ncbi:MAG TPA: hypothetical protein VGB95_06015 [Chitinophagales bacterium]
MKKIFLFFTITSVLFVSSCHQDDNNSNNNNTNPQASATSVPTDANGAFYAGLTNEEIMDENNVVTGTQDMPTAKAWFGTYTATQHAGTVTVNGETLVDSLSGYPIPWYNYYGDNLEMFSTSSATAQWEVSGSSTVTGFNHTDNTAFPTVTIAVPSSISIANSYTLTLANVSADNNGVVVAIGGAGGTNVTKTLAAGATSVTFTSAELHSVAPTAGYPISVNAVVTKYTSATYNGKKYYFVKQYEVARTSTSE